MTHEIDFPLLAKMVNAETLEELEEIGRQHGKRDPRGWARLNSHLLAGTPANAAARLRVGFWRIRRAFETPTHQPRTVLMDRKKMARYMNPPMEKIVRTDVIAAAFNTERVIREGKFLVDLACGHKAYTSAKSRIICLRCKEMLRRSVGDGSEDYESFRSGKRQDRMVWIEDPCRQFNEPTDLVGDFT